MANIEKKEFPTETIYGIRHIVPSSMPEFTQHMDAVIAAIKKETLETTPQQTPALESQSQPRPARRSGRTLPQT